jgi:hypothetical protein
VTEPEPMTAAQADAVYDVLVKHAGASEGWREDFVCYLVDARTTEHRFQGVLGIGGKFWNSGGRWYVATYPEDLTPARRQAIDDTNAALAALKQKERA